MHSSTGNEFPIRAIASLTGVNAITLRAWERRYGLICPQRTPKGHRLYTHEHVERIRRVLALVERGVPIGRVRERLESEASVRDAGQARGPWPIHVERMIAAVTAFDEPELDRIYDEALSLHPVDAVTRNLLLPLLEQLGERWLTLAGGIAEEHFFATYLRSKLGARLQHRMRYATGPRLVAACAPGEQHEIGLLLFALEAQAAGLRAVLLGANTPLDEVAVARHRSRSDAVVLSSSLDPAPGFMERELPSLVRASGAPVFVGGGTAVRHRRAVSASGAIPVGADLEDGVRLILATLARAGIPS